MSKDIKHQRDCYYAVLEGMQFNNLDHLATQSVKFCSELGKEARYVLVETLIDRDTLEARVNKLERENEELKRQLARYRH